MNEKDCLDIALILSTPGTLDELKNAIFKLDKRIEPHFIGFEEIQGRSDDVNELTEKLMEKYNGPNWAFLRKTSLVKTYKECMEEARKEIYGDEYHPGFFK